MKKNTRHIKDLAVIRDPCRSGRRFPAAYAVTQAEIDVLAVKRDEIAEEKRKQAVIDELEAKQASCSGTQACAG